MIIHGLGEHPPNLLAVKEKAMAIEAIIEANGATPATIAILNGVIKIGLSAEEIDELASRGQQQNFRKCGKNDLAYALTRKLSGSITLAATIHIAHLIDIKICVTDGLLTDYL